MHALASSRDTARKPGIMAKFPLDQGGWRLVTCTFCGANEASPSRPRGRGEYLLRFVMLRPFRCMDCKKRFLDFSFLRWAG